MNSLLGCSNASGVVLRLRQHPFDGWHVTSQLVGDYHPWLNAVLRTQYSAEKPPILIHGAPQPVPTFVHRERHFVQVPLVAESRVALAKLAGQQRTKLMAPESDCVGSSLQRSGVARFGRETPGPRCRRGYPVELRTLATGCPKRTGSAYSRRYPSAAKESSMLNVTNP